MKLDHFSDDVQAIFIEAQAIMDEFGGHLGLEHVLLAMIREQEWLTMVVCQILALDPHSIARCLEHALRQQSPDVGAIRNGNQVYITPLLFRMLHKLDKQARSSTNTQRIESERLLPEIITQARGNLALLLHEYGITQAGVQNLLTTNQKTPKITLVSATRKGASPK